LNSEEKGISEATKSQVQQTADKMGYKKRFQLARAGWVKAAFVTSDIAFFNSLTSFFSMVYNHLHLKSVEHHIETHLLELSISRTDEQSIKRLNEIRQLGIEIFLTNSIELAKFLRSQNCKVITVQSGHQALPDSIAVYCDDFEAGRVAARHAYEMGHRVAGLCSAGTLDNPRMVGFTEQFKALGGSCPEEYNLVLKNRYDSFEELVYEFITSLDSLPSLIYCFADNLLFPVIRALSQKELKVPDDVSLIGTDNLYWGQWNQPAFTTIDLCEEFFAEKLIEAIKHANKSDQIYSLAVPVKLLSRETVKRI